MINFLKNLIPLSILCFFAVSCSNRYDGVRVQSSISEYILDHGSTLRFEFVFESSKSVNLPRHTKIEEFVIVGLEDNRCIDASPDFFLDRRTSAVYSVDIRRGKPYVISIEGDVSLSGGIYSIDMGVLGKYCISNADNMSRKLIFKFIPSKIDKMFRGEEAIYSNIINLVPAR